MDNKKKKIIFIIVGLVVLILGVAIIATLTKSSNKAPNTPVTKTPSINTPVNDHKDTPKASENPALAEVVDIEKIDLNKTLSPDDLSLIEHEPVDAPKTVVPKTVAEIELMSEEEKIKMNIDPKLVVQVLGRTPAGQPITYRFIETEDDLLIDTR